MYLFIDFETTGLDLVRDEPIQIGLVLMDTSWNVVRKYSSLIRPTRKIDELKMIVGHMTGLSIAQLVTAPSIDEVLGQISVFFENDPLIIGHNIAFDLSFLQRFFPSIVSKSSLDTYQLAQAFIHYAPSYALEALLSHIESKSPSKPPSFEFHDALQDCLACAHLLQYMTNHISKIAKVYELTWDTNIGLLRQLARDNVRLIINKPLPPLTTLTPDNSFDMHRDTHDFIDLTNCQQHGQYFIGNLTAEQYLIGISKYALKSSQPLIISVSAKPKLQSIKQILHAHGIYSIGYGKQEQGFDLAKWQYFQDKSIYTAHEALFLLGYLSQHYQGLSVLDLSAQYQYQIFHFLSESRDPKYYPITLLSHHGLFHSAQDATLNKQSTIVMMDSERRYKSYNSYINQPFERLQVIQYRENIAYAVQLSFYDKHPHIDILRQHIDQLVSGLTIMAGIFGMEASILFTGVRETRRQIDPISSKDAFRKTSMLREHLRTRREYLLQDSVLCETSWTIKAQQHYDQIINIMDQIMLVEKKVNHQGQLSYQLISAINFTSFPEFLEQFGDYRTMFMSHTDPTKQRLYSLGSSGESSFHMPIAYTHTNDRIKLSELLRQHINTQPQITMVMTDSGGRAREVFEDLVRQGLTQDAQYTIYAENVTGGVQKIVSQSLKQQKNGPLIMIGGYQLLLSAVTAGLPLVSSVFVYTHTHQFAKAMISDLRRWRKIK